MKLHRLPCFAVLTCSAAMAPAQSTDNVLIVVADDLGVDHVAAYGEGTTVPATPNIDALAARGVLFRNAWAYSTCSPTRACVNTGRYAFRTGVGTPGATLSAEETSLPEVLDAAGAGYAHAWIGKWHLGRMSSHPTDAGWSHFAGLLTGRVTDYYRWTRVVNGQSSTSTTYATTQIVDDALAWIGATSGPWICVVAFNAPHDPFHAPPAALHSQSLQGLDPTIDPFPFYQAAVEAMDSEMGRLLSSLGTELARTNVIFLGDNGTPRAVSRSPFEGDHAKGTPYEGGVGVPFVVAGPAVNSPGREVQSLVSAVDLLATCADLIGVEVRMPWRRLDSESFAPQLRDPTASASRQVLYAESFDNGADPLTNGYVTARNERYKMIRRFNGAGSPAEELYDLEIDPFETNDLSNGATTPVEQVAQAELAAHIDAIRDTSGRFDGFGSAGCLGSNGAPLIAGSGTPRVGASYDVLLARGPAAQPVLLTVGDSADAFLGLSLPLDLTLIGAGLGCQLHTSMELTIPSVTDSAGDAQLVIPFPNLPLAVSATLYHTWIMIDPGVSSPLQITTSPGLAATLGR